MRCFNNFKKDRICDLCEISNNNEFKKCKQKYDDKISLNNKLEDIATNCPFITTTWDECDRFTACNKNDRGYGRFAEECHPSLDCEQYILKKEEN